MSKGVGVTPEEQQKMDEVFSHAADIVSVVGVADMPGVRGPVPFIQIVYGPELAFTGWPDELVIKMGALFDGTETPMEMIIIHSPGKLMEPLLAVAFDDQSHKPFFSLLNKLGVYVIEVWTSKFVTRAVVDNITHQVSKGEPADVTQEAYERVRRGDDVLPYDARGRRSRGGSA
jgi:hypothetical protein